MTRTPTPRGNSRARHAATGRHPRKRPPVPTAPPARKASNKSHVVIAVVALVIGVVIGMLLYPHIPFPGTEASLPGRTSVSEGELDMPLGVYNLEDRVVSVSVREAIEETMSLEDAKNSDGTYEIPSVDSVVAIARSRLLAREADKRGITATEQDALEYAEEVYGTSDIAMIASNYGMGQDQVKEMLLRSAVLKKLKDEVVNNAAGQAPNAPTAPEAGKEDEPNSAYAQYIIPLLGDEWNSNGNTWARTDGPFHEKLKNYTISNTEATYSAAQAAYYVASEKYASEQQQVASEWTTFVNETLSRGSIKLSSLVA